MKPGELIFPFSFDLSTAYSAQQLPDLCPDPEVECTIDNTTHQLTIHTLSGHYVDAYTMADNLGLPPNENTARDILGSQNWWALGNCPDRTSRHLCLQPSTINLRILDTGILANENMSIAPQALIGAINNDAIQQFQPNSITIPTFPTNQPTFTPSATATQVENIIVIPSQLEPEDIMNNNLPESQPTDVNLILILGMIGITTMAAVGLGLGINEIRKIRANHALYDDEQSEKPTKEDADETEIIGPTWFKEIIRKRRAHHKAKLHLARSEASDEASKGKTTRHKDTIELSGKTYKRNAFGDLVEVEEQPTTLIEQFKQKQEMGKEEEYRELRQTLAAHKEEASFIDPIFEDINAIPTDGVVIKISRMIKDTTDAQEWIKQQTQPNTQKEKFNTRPGYQPKPEPTIVKPYEYTGRPTGVK